VDRVFEFKNFSANIDGDLLGEIAVGDGGGNGGNVADLRGQVTRHEIDVIRKVLPSAGNTFDFGLATEFTFGADFARHTVHFRGESAELVDHRVDRFCGAQKVTLEFATLDFHRHALGEITFSDSADDAGRFADRMRQAINQQIDGFNAVG